MTGSLAAALRRAGVRDVDDSSRRRAEYSSDASNYRVVPAVVVFPRDVEEVLATLDICRMDGVPVTARGGGTSISGNAIGSGVVLDFSRHLNHVLEVDPAARTAVVQPGAILDTITAAAAPHRLRFGPDPSTHARATIGGALGNNACGPRALRNGRCVDSAVELDIVTGSGDRLAAGRYGHQPLPVDGLETLIRQRLDLIRREFGRFSRQNSGYALEHLLPENGRDLARFLVGSEGTLGVIVQATVRLVTSPAATVLAVLGYPDVAAAADAVTRLLPHVPAALEGLDARLVDLVRAGRRRAVVPELPRGGGWLFVETVGDTPDEARAAAAKLIGDADCLDSAIFAEAAAEALWRVREDGAGLSGRTPANKPAWPGWEDSAVPSDRLATYLRELRSLLDDHGFDGLMYGHFGDGCVHARIDFPLATQPQTLRDFVTEAARLAAGHGGSLSGEHGDGRARSELLPYMYSAEAIGTFAAVKRLFDPDNVLNPGVLVAPAALDASLRLPAARRLRNSLALRYLQDSDDLTVAVHRCVGVGKCRADTTRNGGVMCPSYLATRDEKDSTRGRARVLQEFANGSLVRDWRSSELAESLELCLSCKGCARDCPAGVDMASYKAEVVHQRYRRRLRPTSHYALGWLPRWLRLASRAPRLANGALRAAPAASATKWLAGIDSRRPLPGLAPLTFREWFANRPVPPGRPVLLWADTFTDHFTPAVGMAAVRVLEDAGYSVQIPQRSVCCGLTWISTGQLDAARRQLIRTINALPDDIPIVGLEPSCTAVLRHDMPRLMADRPRAAQVAAATHTLSEWLTSTPGWRPPRLDGIRVVAQPHCHHRAVFGWDADAELLTAAGASVEAVGGCCGLAGNFGMERGHYDVSVAVAETALLPAVRAMPRDATILADGFSCRTQLDHLAGRHAVHLAELLAAHLPVLAPQRRDTPENEPHRGQEGRRRG
jgi:FAD/FMN-containing dehydrogenase/Fe-S oxidoreductase